MQKCATIFGLWLISIIQSLMAVEAGHVYSAVSLSISVFVLSHLCCGAGHLEQKLTIKQMMSANCPCEKQLYLSRNLWKWERERGEREEQEGTLEGLFVWVTVLLVLSPLVPYRKPDRKRKKKSNLSLCSPVSLQFLLAPPCLSFSTNLNFSIKNFSLCPLLLLYLPWMELKNISGF